MADGDLILKRDDETACRLHEVAEAMSEAEMSLRPKKPASDAEPPRRSPFPSTPTSLESPGPAAEDRA